MAAAGERMFYRRAMTTSGTQDRRRAMAGALSRAADRFEARARQLDAQVARWRKDRPHDDAPTVARTLHEVARQLRRWSDECLFGSGDGGSPQ